MTDHVHLLIQIKEVLLSKILQNLSFRMKASKQIEAIRDLLFLKKNGKNASLTPLTYTYLQVIPSYF